jgi:hypothetical protein
MRESSRVSKKVGNVLSPAYLRQAPSNTRMLFQTERDLQSSWDCPEPSEHQRKVSRVSGEQVSRKRSQPQPQPQRSLAHSPYISSFCAQTYNVNYIDERHDSFSFFRYNVVATMMKGEGMHVDDFGRLGRTRSPAREMRAGRF